MIKKHPKKYSPPTRFEPTTSGYQRFISLFSRLNFLISAVIVAGGDSAQVLCRAVANGVVGVALTTPVFDKSQGESLKMLRLFCDFPIQPPQFQKLSTALL